MATGFLTSSTLIESVKSRALLPTNQSTFTPTDFLRFANEELSTGLVPSVLQVHEEYFVVSVDVPLLPNKSNYEIPYRAVGGKLRDVFYRDTEGNLIEMARISPDDQSYFQNSVSGQMFFWFFLRNNEVVLQPQIGSSPTGNLVFTYFLRPNDLVTEDQVGSITSIAKTNLSGTITAISAASSAVITSVANGLTTGNMVTFTQTNSTPSINGIYPVTVIDADHFSIPVITTIAGTTGLWAYKTTTFTLDQIPTGFATNVDFDLMQYKPGFKTRNMDIKALVINATNKTMQFNSSDVSSDTVVNDYIAFAGQSIIPQVPADLHSVLVQRVVSRCLEALGDQAGLQASNTKIQELELKTGILIDNRTEGAPQIINNLRGLLRSNKVLRRGWY